MQPKITIIIPVYNVEPYLRQCLDSVANQTMQDIQAICVNDGSPDNSLVILQEYADRDFRFEIIDKPNRGQAAARNTAFPSIRGRYTMFVDSDDWIDLKACENSYWYAEQTQADFVLFQRYWYQQKTAAATPDYRDWPLLCETLGQKKQLLKTARFTACINLWRSDFLLQHSLTFPEGLINEDSFFFWQAVTRAERIAFLPQLLYYHRQHGTSTMRSFGEKRMDIFQIYTLIEEDLRQSGNYSLYRDEFITRKLREGKFVIETIHPKFRQQAEQRFIETIGQEDIDYLKAMKRHRGTRDYCLSLMGIPCPWHRKLVEKACQLTRPLVRHLKPQLRRLQRKVLRRHISPLENRIVQLNDLVCQLCREIVELKASQTESFKPLKKVA